MNARIALSVLVIAAVAAGLAGYAGFRTSGAGGPSPAAPGGAPGAGPAGSGGRHGDAADGTGRAGFPASGAEGRLAVVGQDGGGAPTPGTHASGSAGALAADPGPAGEGDAERLSERMAKLARDLEYSAGQKEPPQQLPLPQPDPWRADPEREGPPPELQAVSPARGPTGGGQRVEIRGRNLRVVQVMFGAVPADLIAASGSVVVVASPPAPAGPATVTLTNDDGTWASAPQPYVYGE